MITPPLPSVGEALGFMETLHDVVTENIGDELLWPQSLPPVLKENQEIPIAHYSGEFKDKEYYRQKLAGTYGKERQLISGIHFNFSFSEKLMDVLLKSGVCGSSMEEVRETVYFRVVRNFLKYRWLFIWLYGESPLAEETLNVISLKTGEKQPMKCGVSLSLRTSPLGYRNREEFFIDYSSLEAYNMSIDKLIRENRIDGPHELYLPVRIKFLERIMVLLPTLRYELWILTRLQNRGYAQVPFIFSPSACLFSAEGGERKSYGGRTAKGYL